MLILGVFFFQIREQFDSLDLKHMEKLKERVSEHDRDPAVLGVPARPAPRSSRSSATAAIAPEVNVAASLAHVRSPPSR